MKKIMIAACILLVILAVGCGKKQERYFDCDLGGQDTCLVSNVLVSGDVSRCKDEICFSYIASLKSDAEICNEIKMHTSLDERCHRGVLVYSQDYERCYEEYYEYESGRAVDSVLMEDVVEACNFMITQEKLYQQGDDACLKKPAGWKSDIHKDWSEYCEQVKETILTDEKDCDDLNNEYNDKDICLEELSKFRKDYSICDKIEWDVIKNQCMNNIIWQENDIDKCILGLGHSRCVFKVLMNK